MRSQALGRWRGSRRYVRRHCRHWQMAQPPRTQGSDRWPEFLVRVFLDTAFEQIRSAGMMHFEHLPQQFVDLGNIGRRGPTNRHVIH